MKKGVELRFRNKILKCIIIILKKQTALVCIIKYAAYQSIYAKVILSLIEDYIFKKLSQIFDKLLFLYQY
jgi:hypothetical protein